MPSYWKKSTLIICFLSVDFTVNQSLIKITRKGVPLEASWSCLQISVWVWNRSTYTQPETGQQTLQYLKVTLSLSETTKRNRFTLTWIINYRCVCQDMRNKCNFENVNIILNSPLNGIRTKFLCIHYQKISETL